MPFLRALLPLLALCVFALPSLVFAAEASFFGPIIEADCQCVGSAPDWGCVLETAHNVFNLIFSLSVLVFAFTAAYAGFLFMTSQVNAENKSKAKSMLLNTVVGLLIALSAWLLVDFVMRVMYDGGRTGFGPWNRILDVNSGRKCLREADPPANIFGGDTDTDTDTDDDTDEEDEEGDAEGVGPDGNWQSHFDFDGGIRDQIDDASAPLRALLSCMAGNLEDGVGRISSISDSRIANGQRTFAQCGANPRTATLCAHTAGSCHYGGTGTCQGESYAVDFGDEENLAALRDAAQDCAAARDIDGLWTHDEGNHLHVSVDNDRCGCDSGD